MRYTTALTYTDRPSKAAYIADKYRAILGASVLDVGCDQKHLQPLLPKDAAYTGVDLGPPADVIVNLDKEDLPFAAGAFETVIAADVLEHLDRLHHVFDQICTIATSHVIIALPNPLRSLLLALHEGGDGENLKFYGLPTEPPPDRHRWFFGYNEAERFLRERGSKHGMVIEQVDAHERGLPPITGANGRNLAASPNAAHGTIWCVLVHAGASRV